MSVLVRRQIPLLLTIIAAVVIIVKVFIPNPVANYWSGLFQLWSTMVVAISTGLGLTALMIYHLPKIYKRSNEPQKGQWIYSMSTTIIVIIFIVVGIYFGNSSSSYLWLYNTWYGSISGAQHMISAFFCLTGTYRAFKIRNLEAACLVVPAMLIFLYDAPMFNYLIPGLDPIGSYLFGVFDAAGFRASMLAVALGMVFVMLRTIFGLEKGYLALEGQ